MHLQLSCDTCELHPGGLIKPLEPPPWPWVCTICHINIEIYIVSWLWLNLHCTWITSLPLVLSMLEAQHSVNQHGKDGHATVVTTENILYHNNVHFVSSHWLKCWYSLKFITIPSKSCSLLHTLNRIWVLLVCNYSHIIPQHIGLKPTYNFPYHFPYKEGKSSTVCFLVANTNTYS